MAGHSHRYHHRGFPRFGKVLWNHRWLCVEMIPLRYRWGCRTFQTKKWRRINHTTWPPRGGAPITLRVQAGKTVKTYSTEHEMFEQTSEHLSQRFRLAHSAPCYRGQLFDNLGFTGDTKCAQKILEGTYQYPPDTDEWTKKILQEAHVTFTQKYQEQKSEHQSQRKTFRTTGNG